MRLASNSFYLRLVERWVYCELTHVKKGTRLRCNQLNLLDCLNEGSYYIMVAILYLLQNTEGDKSFLWHKQLNDDDNNNNNNNNNNNSNLYTGSSLHKE